MISLIIFSSLIYYSVVAPKETVEDLPLQSLEIKEEFETIEESQNED